MSRFFWYLVSGQAISSLGSTFSGIALSLLVYDLSGKSKLAMAALLAAGMVPEAIMRAVGAPLVDRFNRVRLLAAVDLTQCLLFSVLVLLGWTGRLALWHVFVIWPLSSAIRALATPAMGALVPALVDRGSMTRANSLLFGATQSGLGVGPALAGILASVAGPLPAVAIDAATYLVAGLTEWLIPASYGEVQRKEGAGRAGYAREVAEGFLFFGQARPLLALILITTVTNVGYFAVAGMMTPYVQDFLGAGPRVLGAVWSVYSIGLVAGTFLATALGEVRSRRPLILLMMMGLSLSTGALALVPAGAPWVAPALMGIAGVVVPIAVANISTIMQVLVPDHLRGRVISVRQLIGMSASPLGAFAGALLADTVGLRAMIAVAGLAPALLAALGFILPIVRGLDGAVRQAQGQTTA